MKPAAMRSPAAWKTPIFASLILAGSRDEDAAVRVESVGLMKNRVEIPQVMDSLLNAVAERSQ